VNPFVERVRGSKRNGYWAKPAVPKQHTKTGMACPACGKLGTAVVDSRMAPKNTIRRSRACCACGFRFTTYEAWRPDVVIDFQI
jgi:C4-type Zn-finger protein